MQQLLWYIDDGLWLENIAILNMKGVDYRCVISNTSEYDAIDRLDNFKIDDKGSL